eukprot:gene7822-9633_t
MDFSQVSDSNLIETLIKIPSGSLPESITELSLYNTVVQNISYQGVLSRGSIPSRVEKLCLKHMLFRHDAEGLIPPSVKELTVMGWYSKEGDQNLIPPSITQLSIISFQMNQVSSPCQLFPGVFPDTINSIWLDNIRFDNIITTTTTTTTMNEGYLIPIGCKSLVLGRGFQYNGSLTNIIPPSLETLMIKANRSGDDIELPNGLKYLETSRNWRLPTNFPISVLHSLTHLTCSLETITPGILPPNITSLTLSSQVISIEIDSIPTTVTSITFDEEIRFSIQKETLPSSIIELKFNRGIHKSTQFPIIPNHTTTLLIELKDDSQIIQSGSLPESLTELEYILEIGSIPDSVKKLYLDHLLIKHDPHGLVPKSVEILNLEKFHSLQGEFNIIPIGVRTLKIKSIISKFFSNLIGIPPTLISPGCIPNSVTSLDIDFSEDGQFSNEPKIFPSSIKSLKLLYNFTFPSMEYLIPPNVENLSILSKEIQNPSIHSSTDFPFLPTTNLISLKMGGLWMEQTKTLESLPESITKLVLTGSIKKQSFKLGNLNTSKIFIFHLQFNSSNFQDQTIHLY